MPLLCMKGKRLERTDCTFLGNGVTSIGMAFTLLAGEVLVGYQRCHPKHGSGVEETWLHNVGGRAVEFLSS